MMDAYDDTITGQEDGPPVLPPADFDFLIYSLRLQAELNLGVLPLGEAADVDLDLAHHNIDLLAMLQEKTKGNLTHEEARELNSTLAELRFRFVQAKEEADKGAPGKPFLL
jgi:hypothetical protein